MKKILTSIVCLMGMTVMLTAQTKIDAESIGAYHRSSLIVMPFVHMQDSFAMEVAEAAINMPFPDRYDQLQNFEDRQALLVKLDDHCNYKQAKDTAAYRVYLEALNESGIAKTIVASWFNYDSVRGFNTDYIAEKGHYDASLLASEMASGTIQGRVNIADASDELIGKTFVLVNDMAYIDHASRAEVVNIVTEGIKSVSSQVASGATEVANAVDGLGVLGSIVGLAANAVALGASLTELGADLVQTTNQLLNIEGFAVMECTYLFQLDWSAEVQNKFYTDYYTETADADKLAKFLADETTFRMKYVGMMPTVTNNATAFHAGKYAKLSQEEQITITCSRTQDDAINNLQTKFEEFRVYTPITALATNAKGKVTGVVAPIGIKEGVSAKKKYNIMQCTMTKEGRTVYTMVDANVKADGTIWDNRYAVGEENEAEEQESKGTQFKTKKEVFPGMLLIESSKKSK